MKKIFTLVLITAILISTSACGSNSENKIENKTSSTERSAVTIKPSPDKYTWYVNNYVGKNCASIGYTSIGGDRMDSYGAGYIELIYVSPDGSYVDIQDEEALKQYVVTGQSLSPNTEIKYTFEVDSEGNEFDNLVATKNIDEIVLSVDKVGQKQNNADQSTSISLSPDKYTYYVADYVGRNLADCGYTSIAGSRMVKYGNAIIELIIVSNDGSFIDPNESELLKNYVVTSQNIAPNTEIKVTYATDSNGVEYLWTETQTIEKIELYVSTIHE